MSNEKTPAPAGWYPNPDGGQRFWDGLAWLDLPDQEAADDAERLSRSMSVSNIESSIEEMANEHIGKGLFDGPVLPTTCSPVNGGWNDTLRCSSSSSRGTCDRAYVRHRGPRYPRSIRTPWWFRSDCPYGYGAP